MRLFEMEESLALMEAEEYLTRAVWDAPPDFKIGRVMEALYVSDICTWMEVKVGDETYTIEANVYRCKPARNDILVWESTKEDWTTTRAIGFYWQRADTNPIEEMEPDRGLILGRFDYSRPSWWQRKRRGWAHKRETFWRRFFPTL